jgi:hypothetical protein
MRVHSSAIQKLAGALSRFWQETTRAQELLLRRPWEDEGPLRWQRDLGGRRLIGSVAPWEPEARGRTPQAAGRKQAAQDRGTLGPKARLI